MIGNMSEFHKNTHLSTRPFTLFLLVAAVFFASSYFLVSLLSAETVSWLTQEDHLIENISVLAFFLSSMALLAVFLSSARHDNLFLGRPTRRNIWFALLAAAFFICAGEEISWGQRIFGWDTPDAIEELNAQGETNLHNLVFFHGSSDKNFFQLLLNMNRLLSIFLLTYMFLLPLGTAFIPPLRRLTRWAGVPVPSWLTGLLFVIIFASYKIYLEIFPPESDKVLGAYDEIKEGNISLAVLLLALSFVYIRKADA